MNEKTLLEVGAELPAWGNDRPLTVREAAKFLGVSPQTVYLWVERKQIPHLRVMGRNIRFLKSDLEPFRASFRQEMENVEWVTQMLRQGDAQVFKKYSQMKLPAIPRTGMKPTGNFENGFKPGMATF
jgi:excisionase family DNA binding protein